MQDWGTLFPASLQGASGNLVGFKASSWDFPVLALVLQMSGTDFAPPQQCWTECEQTTWGRDAEDIPRRPVYGAQVPREEPPRRPLLPCQSWAHRESSPSHMLAVHMVWREQTPGGETDEGGGSCGARRSLEPGVRRDGLLCASRVTPSWLQ